MSFYHNPKVITDQLVFCVDAKNPKSYTSGSLVIRDLTSGHSASFVDGTPTFNNDAWQIDGANNYAVVRRESIPDLNFTSGDFSIEIWCKPKSWASYHQYSLTIHNTGASPGTNEWSTGFSATGIMNFTIADASNAFRTITGTSGNNLDEWVHIVGIRSDTTMSLYRNAEIEGTPISTGSLSGSADTNTPLYLGAFRNNATLPEAGASSVFSGSIATVKIYKKALSPTEIKTNYIASRGRFGL